MRVGEGAMKTRLRQFKDLAVGDSFFYDNDIFKKIGEQQAWEYRKGRQYKLWAFIGDEVVAV